MCKSQNHFKVDFLAKYEILSKQIQRGFIAVCPLIENLAGVCRVFAFIHCASLCWDSVPELLFVKGQKLTRCE